MKRNIGCIVTGLALLIAPSIASADTLSDLQAKLTALLAQISALQQAETGATTTGTTVANTAMPALVCPQILRSLSQGSRGSDVSSLQNFLGVVQTGYFGPVTAAAVAQFQSSEGIAPVGIVGPLTRAALARRCGNPIPQNNTFSATPIAGSAPLTVNFSSSVSINNSVSIDFGDGSPAVQMNSTGACGISDPIVSGQRVESRCGYSSRHTYTSIGTYVAKLYVNGPTAGACASLANPDCGVAAKVTITVTNGSTIGAPSISGVDGPTTLQVGQEGTWAVHVTDTSGYLSYAVRWGDEGMLPMTAGTAASAPILSSGTFTHAYSTAGNYAPTFTVTNGNGQSSSASASVVVGATTSPTFTAVPTSGAAPLPVEFRFVPSDDTATTYYVDFGDGSGQPMQRQQIYCFTTPCISPSIASHTYTSAGTYTATVSPYIACLYGNPRCMVAQPAPIASVTIIVTASIDRTLFVTPTSGRAPLTVAAQFGHGAACLDAYQLSWGDGSTPDILAYAPSLSGVGCATAVFIGYIPHTYTAPGTYTITFKHGIDLSKVSSATVTVQ